MFSLTGLRATQLKPQITAWAFLVLLPSQQTPGAHVKSHGPQVVREEKRIVSAARTAVTPNFGAPSHISGERISSTLEP